MNNGLVPRLISWTAIAIAVLLPPSPQASPSPMLSPHEAHAIALLAIAHDGHDMHVPGMWLESIGTPAHPFVPGFYSFSLRYDDPTAGATSPLGLYAVSKRTGDVWEINRCIRYVFPALAAAQARLQRRTGYNFARDKQWRDGLGCPGA